MTNNDCLKLHKAHNGQIYCREVERGDKKVLIYQAVVVDIDNQFLVWYYGELENSKERKLNTYWISKEEFLKKWNPYEE